VLQLVQAKHDDDTEDERHKSTVEGDAQTHCNARNVALDRFVGLTQRVSYSAHGADKPN